MNSKTFFVGIGAQKAGTSWLYDYLRSRGDTYLPTIKELHFFDQVFRPELCGNFGRSFERRLRAQLIAGGRRANSNLRAKTLDLLDRVRMNYDETAYRDFFVRRVGDSVTHFGEITPSYSLLPEEGFRKIKETFQSAKFILILRDPIDRYYSALRMREKRETSFDACKNFHVFLNEQDYLERGRYDRTLTNLKRAVPASDIFVGFYEELFTEVEIRRLCDFLGLPYMPADFAKVVHKSPKRMDITPEMKSAAQDVYDAVYTYCRQEFGDAVPESWNVR